MRITLLLLAFCFGLECSFADEPKKPVEGSSNLEKEAQALLKLQEQIQTETKKLKDAIDKNADKRPTDKDKADLQNIAKLQAANITATEKIIKTLAEQKRSTVFWEAMRGLHTDMIKVEKRLTNADPGIATQEIQSHLVKMLKEFVNIMRSPE